MTYSQLISKATPEQRKEVMERVIKIIGTPEQATASARDLTARINRRNQWNKDFENLSKVYLEHGEKALAMNFTQIGNTVEGVTASGKKWVLEKNWGFTERSRHCGSLWVEGTGTVFTSGKLDKVFDYIFEL